MSNKPAIIVGMESVLAIVQAIDQTAEHPRDLLKIRF